MKWWKSLVYFKIEAENLPYEIRFESASQRDFKSFNTIEIIEIRDLIIKDLAYNPGKNAQLKGKLSGLFKFKILINKVKIRVIYTIDHANKLIIITRIAKRKDIYQILEKYIK